MIILQIIAYGGTKYHANRVLAKPPTVIYSREEIQKKTLQIGDYIALDSRLSGNDKVKNKLQKRSNESKASATLIYQLPDFCKIKDKDPFFLKNLKKMWVRFKQKSSKKFPVLPINNIFLKLTDEDDLVLILRKQLLIHGDLTLDCNQDDSIFFDKHLELALKKFQKRHCLTEDGIVGKKTAMYLNFDYKSRLTLLERNIKRLQKIKFKDKYIIINLPIYELMGINNNKLEILSPVIIGHPQRSTPIFETILKDIILNPIWGVPKTIFLQDKLEKIKEDPSYLSRMGFLVYDNEENLIPNEEADWRYVSKYYMPYTLKQLPGLSNALGLIKFHLDNKLAIYLHDTPQRALFNANARAFSSGCIRVKNTHELAYWILKPTHKFTQQQISSLINNGDTQYFKVKTPIPVYFIYVTVWQHGKEILFSDDPYHLDTYPDKKTQKIILLKHPKI